MPALHVAGETLKGRAALVGGRKGSGSPKGWGKTSIREGREPFPYRRFLYFFAFQYGGHRVPRTIGKVLILSPHVMTAALVGWLFASSPVLGELKGATE